MIFHNFAEKWQKSWNKTVIYIFVQYLPKLEKIKKFKTFLTIKRYFIFIGKAIV